MQEQFQKDLQETIKRTEEFIKSNIEQKSNFLKEYKEKHNKEPNEELMQKVEAKFSVNKAQKVLEFLPLQTYIEPESMSIDKLEETIFNKQDEFFSLGQTKSFMLLYKDSLLKVLKNQDLQFKKYIKQIFKLASNDEFADLISKIILEKQFPLEQILADIMVEKTYFLYKHLFSHFNVSYFDEDIMRVIINDDKFFFISLDSEAFDFQYLSLFIKSVIQFGNEKQLKKLDEFEFDYSENDNEILHLAIKRDNEDIINFVLHKDEVMNSVSIPFIEQLQIRHDIKSHIISKKNFSCF